MSTSISADVTTSFGLSAAATLSLTTSGLAGPAPVGSLDEAFADRPERLLQDLACPAASLVGAATAPLPGAGALTDQVTGVACALSILGYAYRTTYIPPSGPPQVRYTRAVAAVPTPLDVDGNGIPDFTGTVSAALTLTGVNLRISRLAFPASAKVSIEAVLIDPLAPDTYLGFGEDGTAAGTASDWSATVSVFGISSTTTDLKLELATSGAPATLATLGEVFSGPSADAPTHITRGNVAFAPVPASFTTEIRLGDGRQQAIVTSTVPSKVTAQVNLIKPGNRKDIDVTVDKLPASVDVVHESAGGHEAVTYTANAPIAQLTGAYHERAGSEILTAAQLDATDVPTQITFDQVGGRTSVAAPAGALGSVEARFATGGDVPAPGPGSGPYVALHRFSATKLTAGLRLANLHSVSFDASGPYSGRLVFATPPAAIPLSAQDDVGGVALTGSLSNLPQDTTVTADLDAGTVVFDGHGTGIDAIELHATKSAGTFFGRVRRLDATISAIPASETIDFRQSGGGVTVTASNPIGAISLLASDGADAPAVAGSYAWYEDTPSRFRAFVRMSGLKGVAFSPDPAGGSIDTSQAQVLNLHAEAAGVTLDGVIDKLPPHVGFSLTPGAGGGQVVDYDAQGTPIDHITLDATGLALPSGATHLHAQIDALPSRMTLTLPAAGGTIAFDPHGDHVGRVLAQAYGADGPAVAAAGHQLLHYSEPKSQITIDLHNVGAASATESTAPLTIAYDIAHDPLDYAVELTDGTYLRGTVSNPQPATIFVDPTGGALAALYQVQAGGPNFTGNGQIDGIDVYTNAAGGYLEGHLSNLPAHVYLCAQSQTGTRCKPPWVPLQTVADGDTYNVPAPDFAFQLQPLDLNNQVPAERLTFNGRFCPDEPDAATCNANGHTHKRVVIDDLRLNTVEAAFGARDEGCTVACGRAWAAFNTEGDHITGRVRYYGSDNNDPIVNFNAPDPDSFLAANRLFFFVHYDLVSLDPIDTSSSGSLSCGSPKPSAEIEIPGPNVDVLGGTFGVCP